MTIEEASRYYLPFNHIKKNVKPERELNHVETTKLNWWKHGRTRPLLRKALTELSIYFAVPEVSKWATFVQCSKDWLAGNRTKAVISGDFYILGILTSKIHRS